MNLYLDEPGRFKQSLMSKAGYFVFLFVVVLNILYHCLTEVGINWQAMLSFSTDAMIYLCSVYVTFCAMADTAKRDAKATDTYKEAATLCKTAAEQAKPYRCSLSTYVNFYLREDLVERQKACLEIAGITYSAYTEKWRRFSRFQLKKAGLSREERRSVLRANRIRPQKITREALLTYDDAPPRHSPLLSPTRTTAKRYTASLFPSTIFALFSSQIVFAVVARQDPKAVLVEALLRIGLLSWTALRGYAVGEKSVLLDTLHYLFAKADFLSRFLAWNNTQQEMQNHS